MLLVPCIGVEGGAGDEEEDGHAGERGAEVVGEGEEEEEGMYSCMYSCMYAPYLIFFGG